MISVQVSHLKENESKFHKKSLVLKQNKTKQMCNSQRPGLLRPAVRSWKHTWHKISSLASSRYQRQLRFPVPHVGVSPICLQKWARWPQRTSAFHLNLFIYLFWVTGCCFLGRELSFNNSAIRCAAVSCTVPNSFSMTTYGVSHGRARSLSDVLNRKDGGTREHPHSGMCKPRCGGGWGFKSNAFISAPSHHLTDKRPGLAQQSEKE